MAADQWQFGDAARQPQQHRQESKQRQHGADQIDAETFHGGGKSHGVFLHALRGALDGAQPRPVGDIEFVHRGAPAEDVVADEKPRQHADHDRDQRDAGKRRQFAVELLDRDRPRFRKRGLHEIVERPVPAVDGDADLDLEVGREQDQCGSQNRPDAPTVRRKRHPEAGEDRDANGKIEVEPERAAPTRTARRRQRPGRRDQTLRIAVPERHRQRGPDQGRPKEQLWARKERNEHSGLSTFGRRSGKGAEHHNGSAD